MRTLYYAPGAASFVVHWLLIELGLDAELRKVDTAAGEQKSPEYLALNPNGVVPTFVDEGRPMFEAAAIIMTLGDRYASGRLAPMFDAPERATYNQWMFHLANAVQPLFRIWWYPHEPAGEANAELVRQQVIPRIEAAWQRLDDHLAKNGPYLLGGQPSIADFYLTMLMRWSRNMPKPADRFPHLGALAAKMKARPSFATLYEREGLTDWA
ncbi:glutathione S-transferase family protein [Lysobacter sp. TY2-98]|uniref:glutathione S-transferase family protein n=1 Tax=Lysobacter sp. TY2-98 TaxID=2290922 RepID=UPI000E2037CE|nr:glutathione S-transferase family protein [Lysobacter sp. TY2-98]AXK72047.1 glutathione S-transferase family protein [Lysobacter sp. TY2-98]